MIIDVIHLSDGGFWDCIRHSRAPIVASHSNARSLCTHPRNLSDEMLRALGEKGGIAGVNFYSGISERASGKGGTSRAGMDDIVRHIRRMTDQAGEEAVALEQTLMDLRERRFRRGSAEYSIWNGCGMH